MSATNYLKLDLAIYQIKYIIITHVFLNDSFIAVVNETVIII